MTYIGGKNVSHETFERLIDNLLNPTPAYRQPKAPGPARPNSTPAGHKAPAQPKMLLPLRGRLLKLQGVENAARPHAYGKRGTIAGMSKQSRARLMELCASFDRAARPDHWLFLTLTYPGVFPHEPETWHRDLKVFGQRLARSHPLLAALWKLEFQARGAPHFHILLYGIQYMDRNYIARTWYDVVGSGDNRHLVAGTRIERPKTWHGVTWYASKYIGKVGDELAIGRTGRIWGVWNRKALPMHVEEKPLAWREFYALRRIMRRYSSRPKPLPWCNKGRADKSPYTIKTTYATRGCKLFVDYDLGARMAQAAAIAAQNTPI